jgi:hypothetical protein
MSHDDSSHWRARSKDMRALADQMSGGISRDVLHRMAEGYERLAETIEGRPDRFLAIAPVVPAEVRRFAPWKRYSTSALPSPIDVDLPGFLKRGPATADELEPLE